MVYDSLVLGIADENELPIGEFSKLVKMPMDIPLVKQAMPNKIR
jgi:hypothetical protein